MILVWAFALFFPLLSAAPLDQGPKDATIKNIIDFYKGNRVTGRPKPTPSDPDTNHDHWLGDISRLIGSDKSVCGSTDEREVVKATATEHYQWTCYLKIYAQKNAQGYWTGTGFILNVPGISGSVMLTSAHCTYLGSYYGGLAGKIVAHCPGYDPVEVFTPELYADSRYKSGSEANHDIGAIYLKEKFDARGANSVLSVTGFPWTSSLATDDLKAKKMATCGYPGDKSPGTMWEVDGPIKKVTDHRVFYMADTYGGQSGSPVFVDVGDGEKTVVAVHGYGGCPNSAVRLTSDHISPILSHIGYKGLSSGIRSFFVPNAYLRANGPAALVNAQFGCYRNGAESFDVIPVSVNDKHVKVSLVPNSWPNMKIAMIEGGKQCKIQLTKNQGPSTEFEAISNSDGSWSFIQSHPGSGDQHPGSLRRRFLRLRADGVDTWQENGAGAAVCANGASADTKFEIVPVEKCNL